MVFETRILLSPSGDISELIERISKKMRDGVVSGYEINNLHAQEMGSPGPLIYGREVIISYYDNEELNKAMATSILFDGDEELAKRYYFT